MGPVSAARSGLALEPCGPPLELAAGPHRIDSALGADVGLDVDRVVLSSAADGTAGTLGVRGPAQESLGTQVEVTGDVHGTDYDLVLESDGAPFWLVLGQSDSSGWQLDVAGASVGPRQVVDGYANGWLVTPEAPGRLTASVTWTPQALVWGAMAVSAMVVIVCIVILIASRRRRVPAEPESAPPALARPAAGVRAVESGALLAAVGVAAVALLVSTPEAALLAGVATVVGCLVPRATWLWAAIAPAFVLASRSFERPSLAWAALALLGADLAVEALTRRGALSARESRRDRREGAPA